MLTHSRRLMVHGFGDVKTSVSTHYVIESTYRITEVSLWNSQVDMSCLI